MQRTQGVLLAINSQPLKLSTKKVELEWSPTQVSNETDPPALVGTGNSLQEWYLDDEDRLRADSAECVCADQQMLVLCSCSNSSWIMNRRVLMNPQGTLCAFTSLDESLEVFPCGYTYAYQVSLQSPSDSTRVTLQPEIWHFESGNCFVGLEMVDTALKTWNVTVATEHEVLELQELEYAVALTNRTANLFHIRLSTKWCIDVDWKCSWTTSPGLGL